MRRNTVKSCCGSSVHIFATDKPIRKNQVSMFRDAGYSIPEHFLNAGIFYVQSGRLIASASFGSTQISVRCSGDCEPLLTTFGDLLERATNS